MLDTTNFYELYKELRQRGEIEPSAPFDNVIMGECDMLFSLYRYPEVGTGKFYIRNMKARGGKNENPVQRL